MERSKFVKQFREATALIIDFTSNYCYNDLSESCEYLIVPSGRSQSDHLDELEREVLDEWNICENKGLSFEEVVNLLHHDNRVPLWINISVLESTSKKTRIELLCSRRLREEAEVMHQNEIPPFHILVSTPFDYSGGAEKFDINWKCQQVKASGFWAYVKKFFAWKK